MTERPHEPDGRAVYLIQDTAPGLLIKAYQILDIGLREHAIGTIVHDGALIMGAENLACETGFRNFCKKVPEPKNMTEFVCKSLDLFVARLLEHPREKDNFMLAGIGKEGSCQSASKTVAIVFSLYGDLEIPRFGRLGKFDRNGIPPFEQRFAKRAF